MTEEAAASVNDVRHYRLEPSQSGRTDVAVMKWLADVMVREADPPLHYPVIWMGPTTCEVFDVRLLCAAVSGSC